MPKPLLGSRWENGVWKEKEHEHSTLGDRHGSERSLEKIPRLEFRIWERALGQLEEEEWEGADPVAESKSSITLPASFQHHPRPVSLEGMFFTLSTEHKIESLIAHCHLDLKTLAIHMEVLAGVPS